MIGNAMANTKMYPAVRKFLMRNEGFGALRVVRVDRELSGQNRRLYRQSRKYRVKVDVVGEREQRIDVFVLRDSFMLHKAYARAMEEWNKSYEDAKEVVKQSARSRWRDFRIDTKVTASDNTLNSVTLSGTTSALTPVSATDVIVDEYTISQAFTGNAGATRDFGLLSDANTFDILEEYGKEGKVQDVPTDVTVDAAYGELQTDLHSAEVFNLQVDGNEPPYSAGDVGAGQVLQYVGTIYIDGINGSQKMSTGYFDAPLGAVYLTGNMVPPSGVEDGLENGSVSIEVQAGDYKGVNAIPYVDAKALGSGN